MVAEKRESKGGKAGEVEKRESRGGSRVSGVLSITQQLLADVGG